jgi:hypothetical protein
VVTSLKVTSNRTCVTPFRSLSATPFRSVGIDRHFTYASVVEAVMKKNAYRWAAQVGS